MTDLLLTLIAVALLVPLAVLTVECLAALLPPPTGRRPAADGSRPSCAVLIPAHDEEAGLPATLAAVWPQLEPGDRLLVVADNCIDRTAAVARAARAEVLERFDLDRRGKGYALAAGVDALRAGPPEVVIVIDADCRPAPGAIDRLVRSAAEMGRPVQAAYTLDPPGRSEESGVRSEEKGGLTSSLLTPHSSFSTRLSAWAVRVKNVVRPRGLRRLGLPCLLTGSGMAFPWRLLRDAPLASGDIVEDMRLGVDLAIAGHAPSFEPAAAVGGELPSAGTAARSQRTRWEHGHLGTLLGQTPRLLAEAVRQRRWHLAALALELGVPPLSVLGLLWTAGMIAALTVADSWLPAGLLVAGGLTTLLAGLAAWAAFGRSVLPPAALLAGPVYVAAKLPIYLRFVIRRERTWIRTPRDEPPQILNPKSETQ
jgi:cellulose synthase/poly-beta-1,6-N-acetylglucosamine synthase-like glycosyltransferase